MNCMTAQYSYVFKLAALKPPEKLKVSEWADRYRYLSAESSASPGRWKTATAEYQRAMMDAVNEPGIETVVIMSSAQVGKTEIINNILGYFIDQDPSPMLLVQPTLEMAHAWSKDRLSPMLRDTPVLSGKIKTLKSKDSDNTILHKVFLGGHLSVSGANSPASLASRPVRIVMVDEVDRTPTSAGSEGDPVGLAMKRSARFWNRLHVLISTPTIKGLSRIENAWLESDQRRFYVPCPHCGKEQVLIFKNIIWDKNKDGGHKPETAQYACEHCGVLWTDPERWDAVRSGRWIASAPLHNTAGFHIWEAYAPQSTLERIVREFLASKDSPERLKVFVNTVLGEPFEEKSIGGNPALLYERRETYPAEIPQGGLVLTCFVDTQDNRLEGGIMAWGIGFESWVIERFTIMGSPADNKTWAELDMRLAKSFAHESGHKFRLACTMIDSGGHFTQQVYAFVKTREGRRIFATKGGNKIGQPLLGRPSRANKKGINLFTIGTDTAKQSVIARLAMEQPGPGYIHFPMHMDVQFFKELTAEKAVLRNTHGFPKRVWVKEFGERNEALDIVVGNLAAIELLDPAFEQIKAGIEAESEEEPAQKQSLRLKRPRQGWANKWK
jgi:phage terminase large subunit GpA-like protein